MEPNKTGGPAFPGQFVDCDQHNGIQIVREQYHGATLRDYFAAKALAGLLADPSVNPDEHAIAKASYAIADAMLAERAKIPAT